MFALLRKQDAASGASINGERFEFQGQGEPLQFVDERSASFWLRGFDMIDLRHALDRHDLGDPVWRTSDDDVLHRLAVLLVSKTLRLYRSDLENDRNGARSTDGRGNDVAERIIRRLQGELAEFMFEGSLVRLIRADQWPAVRTEIGRSQEVVDLDTARRLIETMAVSPAFLPDRKLAAKEAIALLGDYSKDRSHNSILVVRIRIQSATVERESAGRALTPTQLKNSQLKEDLYWVEIELIDASERPVANEAYTVQLPDGQVRKGKLDSQGRAYVGDIKSPGQCKVCFPDIDASEWRAA